MWLVCHKRVEDLKRRRDLRVHDAMHEATRWFPVHTLIEMLAPRMRVLDICAIPIGENDLLIGAVAHRDICSTVNARIAGSAPKPFAAHHR